nr:unnamed protein product [Digitaria exilis]
MGSSAATSLGFLLLAVNSIMGFQRSCGDVAATLFVLALYASFVLLFCCLRRFEAAPPGSAAEGYARAGVWLGAALSISVAN